MTRDEAREAAKILEAYADGKTIQVNEFKAGWIDIDNNSAVLVGDGDFQYRIKPEPRVWWINPFTNFVLANKDYHLASAQEDLTDYVKVREVTDDAS